MKRTRILLLCLLLALTAFGIAACADKTPPAPETYTVTFDTAGGGTIEPQTVKSGETATKPTDPARTGWTFDGWYLGDAEYAFTEQVTGDITLVAKYESVLGGSGTEQAPFTVDTAAELTLLHGYIASGAEELINAQYVQTADIAAEITTEIPEFAGVYDGGGHALTLNVPLFGALRGTVKNLSVSGTVTSNGASVGLLANTAEGAQIERVTASGAVTAIRGVAGGLVGTLTGGRIEYAQSSVAVTAMVAGGIAGESSGTIINGLASGNISADENGGGIAGVLLRGALVQNAGFGGSVTVTAGNAGGITGTKAVGGAIYRGFVFGTGAVVGGNSGAIAGEVQFDALEYEDTLDCVVLDTVRLGARPTVCEGQREAEDFADFALPAAVWDLSDETPALRASVTLPAQVEIIVNGTKKSAEYGSHADADLFTADKLNFSTRFELDDAVELNSIEVTRDALYGSFTDANATLAFTDGGVSYKADKDTAAVTLTPDGVRVRYGVYTEYQYGVSGVTQVRHYYDVHVYGYTDGKTQYALTVQKRSAVFGYIGVLQMYAKTADGWDLAHEWSPTADGFAGAYITHMYGALPAYLVISDTYTVEETELDDGTTREIGYYLTAHTHLSGNREVSRGMFAMYYGATPMEHTYSPALTFISGDDEDDYCFFREGKLVDAAYSDTMSWEDDIVYIEYEPTDALLQGTWTDGETRYVFDTEAGTVTVGSAEAVTYTAPTYADKTVSFTVGSKSYRFTMGLNGMGENKLAAADGSDLTAIAYIGDYFDGTWLAGDKTVAVASDPVATVTVDGTAATNVRETVENDVRALCFTVGSVQYRLTQFMRDQVSYLYEGETRTYAVKAEMLEHFVGAFVTVSGGERIEISVADDFGFTYKRGNAETVTGKVTLTYNEGLNLLAMTMVVGTDTFTSVWMDTDILLSVNVDNGDIYVFTTAEILQKFTVENWTNGPDLLTIDGSGRAYRNVRGGTTEPIALRGGYDPEIGFILLFEQNGNDYFFGKYDTLDNLYLVRVLLSDTQVVTNFVPSEEFDKMMGEYTYVNSYGPDIITVGKDGNATEVQINEKGEEESIELSWYPMMVNESLTSSDVTVAMALLSESTGMHVFAQYDGAGLSFFGGNMVYYRTPLVPFTGTDYKGADGSVLQIDATKFILNNVTYRVKSVTATENGATVTAEYATLMGVQSVTFTFALRDGKPTLSVKNGDDTVAYTPVTVADVKYPVGTFRAGSTVYTVRINTNYLGEEQLVLEFTEVSASGATAYNLRYDGIRFAGDGKQVIAMSDVLAGSVYICGEGDNLIVYKTLDGTPITATPFTPKAIASAVGNYESGAKKANINTGLFSTTLTLTDEAGTPTEYTFKGVYYDGDVFSACFEGYDDEYNTVTVFAHVVFKEDGTPTTLTVGSAPQAAADDAEYTYTGSGIPLPPVPPPPPPAPPAPPAPPLP